MMAAADHARTDCEQNLAVVDELILAKKTLKIDRSALLCNTQSLSDAIFIWFIDKNHVEKFTE